MARGSTHKKKTHHGRAIRRDSSGDDAPPPPWYEDRDRAPFVVAAVVCFGLAALSASRLRRDPRPVYASSSNARFMSAQECDSAIKKIPGRAVKEEVISDTATVWWICRAGEDPCEAPGPHRALEQKFRALGFAQADRRGWALGDHAREKAQADLQLLRFVWGKNQKNPSMSWHVEAGPPKNASAPAARWSRVLSGVVHLSPAQFYRGGEHQVGDANLSKASGYAHVYLSAAPQRLHRLVRGELWTLVWHLWMPVPFSAPGLAEYRDRVEPALRTLGGAPGGVAADRAAWARFHGDFLAGEGRWPEAAAAYKRATDLDPRDAAAWFGAGKTHLRLGQSARAEECLDRAANLRPRDPEILAALAVLLASQIPQHEKAERLTSDALALGGDATIRAALTAAWAPWGRGDYAKRAKEAIAAAERGTFSLQSWHERESELTAIPTRKFDAPPPTVDVAARKLRAKDSRFKAAFLAQVSAAAPGIDE